MIQQSRQGCSDLLNLRLGFRRNLYRPRLNGDTIHAAQQRHNRFADRTPGGQHQRSVRLPLRTDAATPGYGSTWGEPFKRRQRV